MGNYELTPIIPDYSAPHSGEPPRRQVTVGRPPAKGTRFAPLGGCWLISRLDFSQERQVGQEKRTTAALSRLLQRRLRLDPAREEFIGDSEANGLGALPS